MIFKGFLIGLGLLATSAASASTILTATDSDVNFLFAPLPTGVSLFMFDDDNNNNFAASPNLLVNVPSIVGISGPQSGDYLAANVNGSVVLSNAPNFVMAVYDSNLGGGTWVGDSNPVFYGNGNAAQLTFSTSGGVYVVDVVTVVPVPAAAWLLGSGLIGLVGVARRRHG